MGVGYHLIRPMPADFSEAGPSLTLSDACRRWHAGQVVIRRWHAENGSTFAPYDRAGRRFRTGEPVPDDFATVAPTMYRRELQLHYHVGAEKLRQWIEKSGINSRPYSRSEISARFWADRPRAPKAPRQRRQATKRAPAINYILPRRPIPPPDYSMHGQAADHLRALAPVYRCRESGRADQHGDFYRYGNIVLTPDELIQRAKAKGWEMRV